MPDIDFASEDLPPLTDEDVPAEEEEMPPLPPMSKPKWIGGDPTYDGRALPELYASELCLADLERRKNGEIVGLPWPVEWPALSRCVGPIEPGSLTIVASRPSVGKTMFGMHLLRGLAARGKRVLYVSRELNTTRLIRRHFAAFGASMYRLRSGDLLDADFDAIKTYQRETKDWQTFYDDQSHTIEDIQAEVILTNPDLVIIDYLQRLAYDTEKEYAAITRIVNELQDLTLGTNVPVVCLSQLSRPMKGSENKPPTMSDTRGSGAVEERAATLILLHRHWLVETEERNGKKESVAAIPQNDGWFIVAKNADGEAGKLIPVFFNGPRMTIVERMDG